VWVIGLWCLWRSGRPLWRALAWAYGLLFVLFALTAGAKTYYLGAAYVYLLAAGAVAIDGWLQARPGRLRILILATALLTAVAVPLQLPVLPAADLAGTFYASNATPPETIGWPEFLRTVDAVWTSLPPSQRASAVIFTADYGEAAAINELGRGMGLPTAVSGDNSECSVQVAATLSNPYGLHNQEWGGHVYICTGPRLPWAQLWPQLRHYG
jgi:hypothetical protein